MMGSRIVGVSCDDAVRYFEGLGVSCDEAVRCFKKLGVSGGASLEPDLSLGQLRLEAEDEAQSNLNEREARIAESHRLMQGVRSQAFHKELIAIEIIRSGVLNAPDIVLSPEKYGESVAIAAKTICKELFEDGEN